MIRDWKDGENYCFRFEKGSSQEIEFKLSKRGLFLQKLPKFSAVHASNLVAKASSSLLVTTPISLNLETMLDNVPLEVKKRIDNDHVMLIKRHREDSYLLGNKLWDEEFTDHIAAELLHFHFNKTPFSMRYMR